MNKILKNIKTVLLTALLCCSAGVALTAWTKEPTNTEEPAKEAPVVETPKKEEEK